jgi:subtilisin family serine protease
VIDSGIDLTHPDLNVDMTDAYDFIDNDNVPQDGFGHGTHVAGIIGAKNNNIGVVGVAAGAPLVPIRVLDNTGYGADSGVTAAIDYVAGRAQPGDVINLSLIADQIDPVMENSVAAAADKQIFVVIAAGNNSSSAGNYSPGRLDHSGVFTVSSFGSRDAFSRFSNYGNPPIDYAEPGENITSTYLNGGYATLSGTSMAAPHLSGILLLTGTVANGGTVKRDPDGHPDTVGVR